MFNKNSMSIVKGELFPWFGRVSAAEHANNESGCQKEKFVFKSIVRRLYLSEFPDGELLTLSESGKVLLQATTIEKEARHFLQLVIHAERDRNWEALAEYRIKLQSKLNELRSCLEG